MSRNVFITGTTSGIGQYVALKGLSLGYNLFGLARRPSSILSDSYQHAEVDLAKVDDIEAELSEFEFPKEGVDLIILNAAILGEIKDLSETDIGYLNEIMNINVWSNKVILDYLIKQNLVKENAQVIAISSGAAINGNRGWAGYSLSKSTLNMLMQLYAVENPQFHFTAFAPGLVDTRMQSYICSFPQDNRYPSLDRLRVAKGTDVMPVPEKFAESFFDVIPKLKKYASGSFVDIRKM